jgi:regulator of replication initiation timing
MRKPGVLPEVDDDVLPPKSKLQVNRLQAASEEMLEENNRLWEENARLKKRPVFKASRMNEDAGKAGESTQTDPVALGKNTKRAGSAKRSKTGQLKACQHIFSNRPVVKGSS